MANNFKSDDSFLKKLAIGASGTLSTIAKLRDFGFKPIELERGSTGFKIWKKIKIKRIRVPDILCLETGMRFESRGKTKLEISMSHSLKDARRTWDAGMRDDDRVSIVLFEQSDDDFISPKQISPIHFISVNELRSAFAEKKVSVTTPKGFEEGSEIRVVWPSASANQPSIVSEITPERIALTPVSGGRRQYVRLGRSKGAIQLLPLVAVGDAVESNQIVAAVVPVKTVLDCPGSVGERYYVDKLTSINISERYAAAKALRFIGYELAEPMLLDRVRDPDEDIYVRLEAAAALAAHDREAGWEFLERNLQSAAIEVPLETQLETIIVASELPSRRSERLLISVLRNREKHEELRAGAAWALGQFSSTESASALSDTFNSAELEVKVEAARALFKIGESQIPYLLQLFQEAEPGKRDGIAWTLSRLGGFDPQTLVPNEDENLRKWLSYIIGYGKDQFDMAQLTAVFQADREVYFAASVLWQVLESWVKDLREY